MDLRSIVAWISRNSLLETGAISKVSDGKGIQTHDHLVCKRRLNHLWVRMPLLSLKFIRLINCRSRHRKCSVRKGALKNFANFKNVHEGLQHYQKVTPTQVFSCEICQIFMNIIYFEHLLTAASETDCYIIFVMKTSISRETSVR